MTFRKLPQIAAIISLPALFLVLAVVGGGQPAVAQLQSGEPSLGPATYSITNLGTLGGNNSVPIWITNTGDVIGYSDTAQFTTHAFRWSKGVMQDLGTLGDVDSLGLGGNDPGAVVGQTYYNLNHAFLSRDGAITDLGTLVGPGGYSWAQQINNAEEIAGGSLASDGSFHAVLWNHGQISDLGTLGGPNSFGNGINDRGQIVGGATVSNVFNPILGFPPFYGTLWDHGEVTVLTPGVPAAAFNINNKTQVVGRILVPDAKEGGVAHAFLWQEGVLTDLGVPDGFGDDDSEANSLNDSGQIVGDSGVGFIEGYPPDHALLWQNGGWIDLNTLIPSDSGYYLILAADVNASGQIAVCAVPQNTGSIHAALLTPQLNRNVSNNLGTPAAGANPASSLSAQARHLLALARGLKSGRREVAK